MTTILQLNNLSVDVGDGVAVNIVDDLSFDVDAGECLGIVGESGSGKSISLKAIIGLLPAGARAISGTLTFQGVRHDLTSRRAIEDLRGHGIAMVFQEPMTALNPTKRVGDLIAEGAIVHRGWSKSRAREHAVELMREVGIPDPQARARAWAWELSGGLRQRVMIAMALSCEPDVLLCDEPTTGLDVSVQDQILRLLDRLRRERGLAIVFVTHDLAVVGQIANKVGVMYAGRFAELGTTAAVFSEPRHAYTAALLSSAPLIDSRRDVLVSIGGAPPEFGQLPAGCAFAPRCALAIEQCDLVRPELAVVEEAHLSACIRHAVVAASDPLVGGRP